MISQKRQMSLQYKSPSRNSDTSISSISPLAVPPDITLLCSDGIEISVHGLILSQVSPILRQKVDEVLQVPTEPLPPNRKRKPFCRSVPEVPKDVGPRYLTVSEDSKTWNHLLMFCCPELKPILYSNLNDFKLQTYQKVILAADKYRMVEVLEKIKGYVGGLIYKHLAAKGDPFVLYAIAYGCGLEEEAGCAARETLKHPQDVVSTTDHPVYRHIPGTALHQLLAYRHQCIALIEPLLVSWEELCSSFQGGPSAAKWKNCRERCCTTNEHSVYKTRCAWFAQHLERVKRAYTECTDPSAVVSPTLLNETLAAVSGCKGCTAFVTAEQIVAFNMALKKSLDEFLPLVPLPSIDV
ncbi:hypothetical protein NLI96_g7167 [Meripilus lineatus]|uniref:BTB domain-containing protein n=1 Tax=Meripilus lineatus TaxID=2056292 RepID=A0AAD5UZI2_9APHY|nr:hypothetical protein NLI96_g7167 [Physisporinus lineatus]